MGILKRIKNREERISKINSMFEQGLIAVEKPYREEKIKLTGELAEYYMIKRDIEDEMKENDM